MNKQIYIVIGSNHGDEGKGQVVHDIIKESGNHDALVVRYSGGSQAGHTVTDGSKRHVFKHFGAGSFMNAKTYLTKEFLVDPVNFMKELTELKNGFNLTPVVHVNSDCRVVTPYDVLMNIVREEHRSSSGTRHGTCACGIYETILRSQTLSHLTVGYLSSICNDEKIFAAEMDLIKGYYFRLSRSLYGEVDQFFEMNIAESYRKYFCDFIENVNIDLDYVLAEHKTIVFESSQGLLLDEKYGTFPHLTPSSLGIEVPYKYINDLSELFSVDCEVRYLTRPYMTRHGAGPMDNELSMSNLPIYHPSETNVFNKNQGSFRYGILNLDDYFQRSLKDFNSQKANFNSEMCYQITCNNHITDSSPMPFILDGKLQQIQLTSLSERNGIIIRKS